MNPFPKTSSGANGPESNLFDSDRFQKFLEMVAGELPPELVAQLQEASGNADGTAPSTSGLSKTTPQESMDSPMGILRLVEPLINEKLVLEINTSYEFHIKIGDDVQVYHLDLKCPPRGSIGRGPSLFSKCDCVIKLNDHDLKELLMDNLKPFTAYMSGRIEVEGALQDVFRLKKLISSVNTILSKHKN